MKKQPVGDRDDAGNFQKSWLWICDECGHKEIHKAEVLPGDWSVENEDDLEYTRAVCQECTDHGLEA
mgnify:CR=1 FL=1